MSGDLASGVRRLRPDDHFMLLAETDASPMHVGALLLLQATPEMQAGFHARIVRHLAERLPGTPLQARLLQAPDGYDSDVWSDVAALELDYHIFRVEGRAEWDDAQLLAHVAELSMERLDLGRVPFRIFVFERLTGGRSALYVKIHHAVADGVGFQTLLAMLSDAAPVAPVRTADAQPPSEQDWRARAAQRFAAEEAYGGAHAEARRAALAGLERLKADPATRRARTPVLKLSGPTALQRSYVTLSLPFSGVRALGRALGGTVNDILLALVATALRRYLMEIDDLPDTPIVLNSARSYRRAEHGAFGNRIVAQHPHIATTTADPMERLRAIQASMASERARTALDEAMLDQPERPFGARDRRAKFAERARDGRALLPGNITVSNVPGPPDSVSYAGCLQLANYPVPIIGSGRFLNLTSRRYADALDIGLMADPTKIAHVDRIARYLTNALELHKALVAP